MTTSVIIASAYLSHDPVVNPAPVKIVELPDLSAIETLDRGTYWWSFHHALPCGCNVVQNDCCEPYRLECESTVVNDSNGDPDVRVCVMGKGCDSDTEKPDMLRNAYMMQQPSKTAAVFAYCRENNVPFTAI